MTGMSFPKRYSQGKINLEIAPSDEIINVAQKVNPSRITVVPGKRKEITKEGGFDAKPHKLKIKDTVNLFYDQNITVSLLVEPSKDFGADL